MVISAAATVFAERQPLSRYQSVINRQMFGELPADFDPDKMPSEVAKTNGRADAELTKEQEQLKSAVRFSSINITPDGETAVGFTDNSDTKTPHHYYLRVGEKNGPWELKEANAEEQTMTVAKGDIMITLKLGGDSSKEAGATSRNGSASTSGAASHKSPNSGPLSNLRQGRNWKARLLQKLDADAADRKREREEYQARREADEAEKEALKDELASIRESVRKKQEAVAAQPVEETAKAEAKEEPTESEN